MITRWRPLSAVCSVIPGHAKRSKFNSDVAEAVRLMREIQLEAREQHITNPISPEMRAQAKQVRTIIQGALLDQGRSALIARIDKISERSGFGHTLVSLVHFLEDRLRRVDEPVMTSSTGTF